MSTHLVKRERVYTWAFNPKDLPDACLGDVSEDLRRRDDDGCHNLVSFLLQILQVINELHDLMTFFLILSYLSHFLSFYYLIKGKTT